MSAPSTTQPVPRPAPTAVPTFGPPRLPSLPGAPPFRVVSREALPPLVARQETTGGTPDLFTLALMGKHDPEQAAALRPPPPLPKPKPPADALASVHVAAVVKEAAAPHVAAGVVSWDVVLVLDLPDGGDGGVTPVVIEQVGASKSESRKFKKKTAAATKLASRLRGHLSATDREELLRQGLQLEPGAECGDTAWLLDELRARLRAAGLQVKVLKLMPVSDAAKEEADEREVHSYHCRTLLAVGTEDTADGTPPARLGASAEASQELVRTLPHLGARGGLLATFIAAQARRADVTKAMLLNDD